MDEVAHRVDDGAHARPGEEHHLHRGHQRLVLRVAELVAFVGGLVELAGHEDGEEASERWRARISLAWLIDPGNARSAVVGAAAAITQPDPHQMALALGLGPVAE